MPESVVSHALALYRRALSDVFDLLPDDSFSDTQVAERGDPRPHLACMAVLGPSFDDLPEDRAAALYALVTPEWTQRTRELGVAVMGLAADGETDNDGEAARFAVDRLDPDQDWQDYRAAYCAAYTFLLVHRDGGQVATDLMLTTGDTGMSDDEVHVALTAALDAQARFVPDDAPPCDKPGCDRPGVILDTITTPQGTRVWHWCVTHDTDDPES